MKVKNWVVFVVAVACAIAAPSVVVAAGWQADQCVRLKEDGV